MPVGDADLARPCSSRLLHASPAQPPSRDQCGPCSSILRQIPSQAFLLYRRCNLGLALFEAIDECLESGAFSPLLGYRLVQQFDHSVAKELARARSDEEDGKRMFRFMAERIRTYRIMDGLVAVVLENSAFYQLVDPADVVRIREEEEEDEEGGSRAKEEEGKTAKRMGEARRKVRSSGVDAVMVRVCEVPLVSLLTYSPFVPEGGRGSGRNVDVGSRTYRIRTCPGNVNPRLEFFSYVERRRRARPEPGRTSTATATASTHSMVLRPLEQR